jgi:hypothetical protein
MLVFGRVVPCLSLCELYAVPAVGFSWVARISLFAHILLTALCPLWPEPQAELKKASKGKD